jgi:hypothetical protein
MFSLALVGSVLAAPASAIEVFVRAMPYVETMPDGTQQTMWGYRVHQNRNVVMNNPTVGPFSPGAAIRVPHGDTTLTVRLINSLPVPTSFVLHGHNTAMTPVFTDSTGAACTPPAPGTTAPDMKALQAFRNCRVRSFTSEAPPRLPSNINNAAHDVAYTYLNVKPGTYLYQSGTMPQIQVQMGLYGVVRKDALPPVSGTGSNAYPNVTYDNDITLLLSEVDPAVHGAVAAGKFNTSTLAYDPKYFRLHHYAATSGACSTTAVSNCLTPPTTFTESPTGAALGIQSGQRQLVRAANAGIQSRVLELIDGHWYVMAEDGNPFPYPREQYSTLLPAAKTADMWFTPTVGGTTAPIDQQLTIFDRRMALTNNNADASGGQLLRIDVGATGQLPTVEVAACATAGTQGIAYACTVGTNLASNTFSLDIAPTGMTINSTTGAIAWTPNNAQASKPLLGGQTASNPVQVRVTGTNGRSDTGSFSVVVANVNDAPAAGNDVYDVRGGALNASTVLANDSDPDGDPLGTIAVVSSLAGVTMNANGTFSYATIDLPLSGFVARTFTYSVSDGTLASLPATVTLNVHANSAPVAVDDVVSVLYGTTSPVTINVLINDYDVDGNLNGMSLAFTAPNQGGTAVPVIGNGVNACPLGRMCIAYTPPATFRGTETIQYTVSDALGATSNWATLRLNVQ